MDNFHYCEAVMECTIAYVEQPSNIPTRSNQQNTVSCFIIPIIRKS